MLKACYLLSNLLKYAGALCKIERLCPKLSGNSGTISLGFYSYFKIWTMAQTVVPAFDLALSVVVGELSNKSPIAYLLKIKIVVPGTIALGSGSCGAEILEINKCQRQHKLNY